MASTGGATRAPPEIRVARCHRRGRNRCQRMTTIYPPNPNTTPAQAHGQDAARDGSGERSQGQKESGVTGRYSASNPRRLGNQQARERRSANARSTVTASRTRRTAPPRAAPAPALARAGSANKVPTWIGLPMSGDGFLNRCCRFDSRRGHCLQRTSLPRRNFPANHFPKSKHAPATFMWPERLRKDCPTFAVTADAPFPQWLRARSLGRGSVFQ